MKDLVGNGVYRWRTLGAMSASGVIGNPDASSEEKCRRLVTAIADEIAGKLLNEEMWALPYLSETVV